MPPQQRHHLCLFYLVLYEVSRYLNPEIDVADLYRFFFGMVTCSCLPYSVKEKIDMLKGKRCENQQFSSGKVLETVGSGGECNNPRRQQPATHHQRSRFFSKVVGRWSGHLLLAVIWQLVEQRKNLISHKITRGGRLPWRWWRLQIKEKFHVYDVGVTIETGNNTSNNRAQYTVLKNRLSGTYGDLSEKSVGGRSQKVIKLPQHHTRNHKMAHVTHVWIDTSKQVNNKNIWNNEYTFRMTVKQTT